MNKRREQEKIWLSPKRNSADYAAYYKRQTAFIKCR